ncbi:MAG: glycosyl hydrolase family 18 protein [Terriglobales bacterium]
MAEGGRPAGIQAGLLRSPETVGGVVTRAQLTTKIFGALGLFLLCVAPAFAKHNSIYYYVPADDAWNSLVQHADQIPVLAPQVYIVDEAGVIHGAVEERVLRLAQQHHIGLMPLLANDKAEGAHAILRDTATRAAVIADLLQRCMDIRCIGLQVDLEGVLQSDSAAYTDFIRTAALAFHARHLQLSVAVPTPLLQPAAGETYAAMFGGFAVMTEPYDLKEIARSVDFVTLMTYGQYGPGMPPGPVAGYFWVEQSIRYALQYVPAKKLSMGLGFWAYRWCNQQITYSSYGDVANLAAGTGAVPQWHAWNRSPWFAYDRDGCRNVVWYENSRSLREKMGLLAKYHLHGFSAWRLGQEDPAFWGDAQDAVRH